MEKAKLIWQSKYIEWKLIGLKVPKQKVSKVSFVMMVK